VDTKEDLQLAVLVWTITLQISLRSNEEQPEKGPEAYKMLCGTSAARSKDDPESTKSVEVAIIGGQRPPGFRLCALA
jgi:hypothetical protein